MHLLTPFAFDLTLTDTHADYFHSFPCLQVAYPNGIVQDQIRPPLLTTMTTLDRVPAIPRIILEVTIQRLAYAFLDVIEQVRLVVFHWQDIIAVTFHDLFGDLLLAAHGINRDQSAVQVQ